MARLKKHLKIEGFNKSEPYKYPKNVVVSFKMKERNRTQHGSFLKNKLDDIRKRFTIAKTEELAVEGKVNFLIMNRIIYAVRR